MTCYLWQLLLLNFCLKYGQAQGFGMNLIKIPDEDKGQIVCTVALLRKYFQSGESLSGSVLHMSITSAVLHLQKSLLQALHADPKYPWSIVVKEVNRRNAADSSDGFILHEKPQCYFMVIDNMDDEDMDTIFESWKSNVNWNPLAQFVVYLSSVEETAEEMTDIMIEILLNFMNKKIYNVNVIGQNEEENYYYGKSVFPYHPDNNCGNRVITIETLDLCDYQDGDKEEDEEEEDQEEETHEEGEEEEERNEQPEEDSRRQKEEESNHDEGNNEFVKGEEEEREIEGESNRVEGGEAEESFDKSKEQPEVGSTESSTEMSTNSDSNTGNLDVTLKPEIHEQPTESGSQETSSDTNDIAPKENKPAPDQDQTQIESSSENDSKDERNSTETSSMPYSRSNDDTLTENPVKLDSSKTNNDGRSNEQPLESSTQENYSAINEEALDEDKPEQEKDRKQTELSTETNNDDDVSTMETSSMPYSHTNFDITTEHSEKPILPEISPKSNNDGNAENSDATPKPEFHEQPNTTSEEDKPGLDRKEMESSSEMKNNNISSMEPTDDLPNVVTSGEDNLNNFEVDSKQPDSSSEMSEELWGNFKTSLRTRNLVFQERIYKNISAKGVKKKSKRKQLDNQESFSNINEISMNSNSDHHLPNIGSNKVERKPDKDKKEVVTSIDYINNKTSKQPLITNFPKSYRKVSEDASKETKVYSKSKVKFFKKVFHKTPPDVSLAVSIEEKQDGAMESVVEINIENPLSEFSNITNTELSTPKSLDLKVENESESPQFYIEEMYRALFLDKFPKDLSGCPLVAAYRPWEPYIFNEALRDTPDVSNNRNPASEQAEVSDAGDVDEYGDFDEDGVGNVDGDSDYKTYDDQFSSDGDTAMGSVEIRLNGIEYKMVQTIGERLHISIDMQVENTNVYHLFQQLIDGDIEMVIGGIDEDPSISQYVSSTIPYHQDDLTWCVAKARRSHNLFNFMATFDIKAWILTLLFILTASFGISMIQKMLKLQINILKSFFSVNIYIMGVILSQSVNLPRIPTSLKLCFGTTFFMGLIFSNVYQSFLISTLTTPKSSYQISHIEEIYVNRMDVMGSVDNVRHLSKEGETFRYVRENFHMCYNIEECLHRAALDPKLAVAVSRQHSFYNPRIPRDHLYCFDRNENIYVYLVTMLLPKKFHLLHKINPVIQHIIESGHMHKWARDLDMRRKIIEEIQRAHEEPFKSLTLNQVVGPFAFNIILQLFALLVFGMEHLVHWLVVRRRTRLKIAKYLHRKFV